MPPDPLLQLAHTLTGVCCMLVHAHTHCSSTPQTSSPHPPKILYETLPVFSLLDDTKARDFCMVA